MEERDNQGKKELLVLAIELGDQNKKLLKIFSDSKPEQLAYDFCLQNNLDFESLQNLTEEIKNVLANNKNGQTKFTTTTKKIDKKSLKQNTSSGNKISGTKIELRTGETLKGKTKIKEVNAQENKEGTVPSVEKEGEEMEGGEEIASNTHNNFPYGNLPTYLAPTEIYTIRKREKFVAEPPEKDFMLSFKPTPVRKYAETEEEEKQQMKNFKINENTNDKLPKEYHDFEGDNAGAKMYNRDLKKKEELKIKTFNKVQEDMKDYNDNLTFAPKINDFDLKAIMNRRKNKTAFNDEERILYYKDYVQAKIENTKNKLFKDTNKEKTQSSFNPKINEKSIKLVNNNKTTGDVKIYEKLYNTKRNTKNIEEQMYHENTFKPKINKNYKTTGKITEAKFDERLRGYQKKSEKKKEQIVKDNIIAKKDLFKPKINKSKKYPNKEREDDVYNDLYTDSEKYRLKKEELAKRLLNEEKNDNEFKASSESEKIYSKHKLESFEKIFNNLDVNADGQVTKDDIENSKVPKRLIRILGKVTKDITKNNGSIGKEDFINKCNEIYDGLQYANKKEIYLYIIKGGKSIYDNDGANYKSEKNDFHDKRRKKRTIENMDENEYYVNSAYAIVKTFQDERVIGDNQDNENVIEEEKESESQK